ncbi:MAG: ACT domain-containing protein, partial [Dermatophilaceae bacterium]
MVPVNEPDRPPPPDPEQRTLLVALNGPDRPGVTRAVFEAAASVGAEVVDLEQVVVRGHLTLAALLAPGRDENVLADRLTKAGESMGMTVNLTVGRGDNARRRTGRVAVVVMASRLETYHLAAVSAAVAEHGANIDRIRRLSRWPVTTVELDVSGADVLPLRRALALAAADSG